MNKKFSRLGGEAFTMVEMLVVIAVLAVLVLMGFSGMQSAARRVRVADSTSVMKNIGSALSLHAVDYGTLPGPLLMTHYPNANSPNQLLGRIWPYLALPAKPARDEMPREFVPLHWREWVKRTQLKSPGSQVVIYTSANTLKDSDGERTLVPFGYPGESNSAAMPWSRIASSAKLASTILVEDSTGTPLKGDLSPKIGELQNYRTRLFLDWHVEVLDLR